MNLEQFDLLSKNFGDSFSFLHTRLTDARFQIGRESDAAEESVRDRVFPLAQQVLFRLPSAIIERLAAQVVDIEGDACLQ